MATENDTSSRGRNTSTLQYPHPFSNDHYNHARIQKIPATKGKHPSRATDKQQRFYMDFGFLRASNVHKHIEPPPQGPPPITKYPCVLKPPPLLDEARYTPLPLRRTSPPDNYLHAAAARTATGHLHSDMHLTGPTPSRKLSLDQEMMVKNDITRKDMMMIYLSPHPFRDSFEEEFCLLMYDHVKHPTAGLVCSTHNG
jgi:hypothetical protein